jgi:hypothetical protein
MSLKSKYIESMKRKIFIPLIMLACINALWVLSAWPASLSPDSLGVIDYIKQGRYFDWHTTTWLLYVKLTTLNANAIWLSIIFQVILMNYLVYELIRFFRPEIKRETTIWFCLLLVSTPWIGANQVTLWKDVTFTIFVLLGMLWIIKATQKKNYSVKGMTALTFGSACRHEGWLTLLFALLMVILVLLYNRKAYYTKEKQSLLVSLVIAIVLSAGANNFLASLTNAEKNPSWTRTQTFLGDIAYVVSVAPDTLDPATVKFVESHTTSPIGLSRDVCENAAPFVQSNGFDQNVANSKANEVLAQWIKVLVKNPKDLAKGHFCKSKAFFPWPFTQYTTYSYYWFEWGMWVPNWLNMEPQPPLPILRSIMTVWLEIWNMNGRFLSATGWQITLLSLLLVLLKRKSYITQISFLAFMTLAWARDILLILLGHGGDGRLSILISILMLSSGAALASKMLERKN